MNRPSRWSVAWARPSAPRNALRDTGPGGRCSRHGRRVSSTPNRGPRRRVSGSDPRAARIYSWAVCDKAQSRPSRITWTNSAPGTARSIGHVEHVQRRGFHPPAHALRLCDAVHQQRQNRAGAFCLFERRLQERPDIEHGDLSEVAGQEAGGERVVRARVGEFRKTRRQRVEVSLLPVDGKSTGRDQHEVQQRRAGSGTTDYEHWSSSTLWGVRRLTPPDSPRDTGNWSARTRQATASLSIREGVRKAARRRLSRCVEGTRPGPARRGSRHTEPRPAPRAAGLART